MSKPARRNSCLLCKQRKVRCDMNDPCANCKRKGAVCQYPVKDNRSVRFTVSKMEKTQTRLRELETLLGKIRDSPTASSEVIALIDQGNIASDPVGGDYYQTNENFSVIAVPESDGENSTIFGPISVFKKYSRHGGSSGGSSEVSPNNTSRESEQRVVINDISYYNFVQFPKTSFDSDLYDSISSFFKWQYTSNYMFIHRESFLFHFLQHDFDNSFVSEELIYAIAALGARFSSKRILQLKAGAYYSRAMSKMFLHPRTLKIDFSTATLTKLQSLLCLAFLEIACGNLTSGWLLSGIAFRIGSNIGFERDPSEWENGQRSLNNVRPGYPFDLRVVQRRIYWGTYIADHFISLIFGRYPSLKRFETSIGPSSDLYNLTNIHDFLFYDPVLGSFHASDAIVPLEALVTLARISESMLLDVFAPVSTTIKTKEKRAQEIRKRLHYLAAYNTRLDDWVASLPDVLSVANEALQSHGHNYVNIAARSSYFLTRLSLNRPFAIYSDEVQDNKSLALCEDTVIQLHSLLQSIDKVYGLVEFEPTIPLVYSIVLGTSVLSLNISRGQKEVHGRDIKSILNFFLKFLEFSSGSLEIAKSAMDVVQTTLSRANGSDSITGTLGDFSYPLDDDNVLMDTILNGDVIDCVFDPDFFLNSTADL